MSSVRTNKQTGRDTFHIVAEFDGIAIDVLTTGHGPKVALLMAMGLSERSPEEGATYDVWRRTTLGPEVHLYHVEKDEDGTVHGYTVQEVD